MKKSIIIISALIISITLIATACTSKSKTLTLKGDIQNNIISSNTTIAGKIIKMNKQQGEAVKKGDILAVIDNTNQKFAVDQLQGVVDMKKAKLEELRAGTRQQQIQQAEAQVRANKAQLDLLTSGNRTEQIAQAKSGVSIAKEAVATAQIAYNHINSQYNTALKSYEDATITKTELDEVKFKLDTAGKQVSTAKYQLESAKQQLALLQSGSTSQSINAAKANYDAATAQLSLLKSGATKQSIDAAQADLVQAEAQLNQAKNTLNNCNIAALEDGIIISKIFELGDVVNVGSNIADIAVANDVYVLCYLPNEYLDRIYYNEQIKVSTSLGVQTGKVSYIALKNEYTPKDKQSTADRERIATKIKIAINSNSGRLKSGLTANIEIPLNNNK